MDGLSFHAQVVGTILIVCLLITVFELIRRNHLQERYAVTWVVVLLMLLAFTLMPGLFSAFSALSGVKSDAIAFLSLLSFVELVLLLHLSAHASKQNAQVVRLYQKLAILQETVDTLSRRVGDIPGTSEIPPQSPSPSSAPEGVDGSATPPDDGHVVDESAAARR